MAVIGSACLALIANPTFGRYDIQHRQRVSINDGWRFFKYESIYVTDHLIYDIRPEVEGYTDDRPADDIPVEALELEAAKKMVLKPWILPTANRFIKDASKHHIRPEGNPGHDFGFVQNNFDDSKWEIVNLPHDWAIEGPFFEGSNVPVGGGMGRLPAAGVAWYRRDIDISNEDKGKSIFLDIDGAMSHAMVWLNGHLVGGWPYGYASFRLDLTPYIIYGQANQLAIRLDNPPHSSRWYPGAGIYRNVWLVKANPVHIGQWGTFVTTTDVSNRSATVNLDITIDNDSPAKIEFATLTQIFRLDNSGNVVGRPVAQFRTKREPLMAGESTVVSGSARVRNPQLWGPPPTQTPNMYVAVTTVSVGGEVVDKYETPFGIRTIVADPLRGLIVNGERIPIKGVNMHHDLGALGAAFNVRAAERQLEKLREMGTNAIRVAHHPMAPEWYKLTDRMGFLVVDEIFDVWERRKTPLDFHLIFPDWYEADTRAFIRRNRNHPSIIMWSFGNEVGEQYTDVEGALVARRLNAIFKEEDPTRPTTASKNWAKPDMPFPAEMDVISLNYQGEGIRFAPAYAHLQGIRTKPMFPGFQQAFPNKMIVSSESSATISTRGIYLFPVFDGISAPIKEGQGGDPVNMHVCSYELYTANFGSSPDKVFASLAQHPFVAGQFVWAGWDYIGEPTPYYGSRSSSFGIIDLAGFRKNRFYLYKSQWRPDAPFVHIFPHWNWSERVGMITPVHIFTTGDEAELFLNGRSLGKKRKGELEFRLRWDNVIYEPGELKAIAYKDGVKWAEATVQTTGQPAGLVAQPDRNEIYADGKDLSFVTVQVVDNKGRMVPIANNMINFTIEGPGEIVATDNGDPADMLEFPSHSRNAFNGKALVIVRGISGEAGSITLRGKSENLEEVVVNITTKL